VPGQQRARVRSIHAQNRPAERAHAGQRCALNLAGIVRTGVERGQWICDPAVALATDRLDARVSVWRGEAALRAGASVHLHVGAADRMARVAVLQSDPLMPGASGYVQLIVQRELSAWRGDRVVLRDAAAARTLAGGEVLDPSAPARYRKTPQRLAELEALAQADPAHRLDLMLPGAVLGVPLQRLQCAWALQDIEPVLPESAVRIGSGAGAWAIAPSRWDALQQMLLAALAKVHEHEADSIGVEQARLQRIALPRAAPIVVEQAIEALLAAGRVARQGAFLHLPEHAVRLSEQERRLAQRVLPLLQAGDADPPWVRDIARELKQTETVVRITLARLARKGEVFQVVKDLYLHGRTVEKLAATARELAQRDGAVRAAPFRDATGLGRKRAIQILEFFDRIGLLRRVRDTHLVRPGSRLFLGQAASL